MALVVDPTTGMEYDDGTGDVVTAPGQPTTPQVSGNDKGYPWARPDGWAPTPYDPAKEEWLRGQIKDLYQQYYQKDPSESEILAAINAYTHYGGEYMNSFISGPFELGKDKVAQGSGRGGGGGGFGAFTAPEFNMPNWAPPAAFQYADFVAPDENAVLQDPGYAFRRNEGQRALRNSASANGLARTGGFEKEMQNYIQGLGSQEYGNVYNRRWNEWQGGYNAKAQDYERNWRQQLTDYSLKYQQEADEYARALSSYGVNLDAHNANFGNSLSLYNLATRNLPQYTPISLPAYSIPTGS